MFQSMDSVILLEFIIHFDAHILGIAAANFGIFLRYSASSYAFRNSSYYFGRDSNNFAKYFGTRLYLLSTNFTS